MTTDPTAVLDVAVIGIDPDCEHDVIVELIAPCPYCGMWHRHTDSKTVAVGTLLHRSAHCLSDSPRRGRRGVAPGGEYLLRVVRNQFVEGIAPQQVEGIVDVER